MTIHRAAHSAVRAIVLCAVVLRCGTPALGQAAAAPQKPFEPEIGQPGKDVVWVPTSEALVARMLDMAKVTPMDVVIDLGSGDGRTVIAAATRGAHALGIEYNPEMVELSKRNAAAAGVNARASFVKADLFETDLTRATVITMFLLPEINLKLQPRLLALKPGTRIVSNSFYLGEWPPDETSTIYDDCDNFCTALLWIVPAKVEGTWQLPTGTLELTRRFQKVSGTLDGKPIADGLVLGDRVTFTVGDARYEARVDGRVMHGTATGGGIWTASRK